MSGIYLLDVPTAIHDVFPVLKIKVSAEEALVSAVEYKYPGAKRQPAAYPIGASPFPSAPVTALAYTESDCLRLTVCMYVCLTVCMCVCQCWLRWLRCISRR